ncbi:PilW family protein [Rhodoferax sp. U11-2br]|uniref:PilW family protein n=1 Tax=Rhodoferax sp. U11-2br TaxID=2838878 RepID=UPI001BE938AB|nr:PilW family protein [Rhodoferax sp. U11-2br]MBT3066089.1 prepilin-type N-terminal cleavage/methylation domain-containing protein [Rhodoferax sp. U11-2br]
MTHVHSKTRRSFVRCDCTLPRRRQRGLTLIELMVSLVLGLILVGGVLSIFVSTTQTARVNDNLMRIQENARMAFDLMARDLREAGHNPCGSKLVANVLRSSGAIPVWANWNAGTLRGYDNTQDETGIKAFGTTTNTRVSGTDAVLMIKADLGDFAVVSHDTADFQFALATGSNFQENDIALVCDGKSAAIFQIYDFSPKSGANKGMNISHQADSTNINCSNFLAYTAPASNCPANTKKFEIGAETPELKMAPLGSYFWYVGNAEGGKRSLYRSKITRSGNGGKTIIMYPDEMIPNVQDLQITYLTRNGTTGALANDWVAASSITDWADDSLTTQVVAVRLDLTLQSTENVSSSQSPIQRHLIHIVGLRNRDTFIEPAS